MYMIYTVMPGVIERGTIHCLMIYRRVEKSVK